MKQIWLNISYFVIVRNIAMYASFVALTCNFYVQI
jgi:hypothetical protein